MIVNLCGVCPGVDIIASIAQYSTEIFPMTGPALVPCSHGHHHHHQPPHWSLQTQIQSSDWLLSSEKYFLSQSKKCHKLLQMSNEFVWHLLLTMMKPWMTIQSLFNDTLVHCKFIELCFEFVWSQSIEPGSDWPASMTDIELDSCNADYCTEPQLNKHWLYIGAQNQSWVVNWSI